MQFQSLQGRFLTILILVAVTPLLLFAVFDYFGELDTINSHVQEKLVAVRDLKVQQIDAWLDERIGDLRLISSTPVLRTVTEYHEGNVRTALPRQQLLEGRNFLRKLVDHYQAYGNAMLVDRLTMEVEVSAQSGLEGTLFRYPELIHKAIEANDFVISDIFSGSTSVASPNMFCVLPIIGSEEHANPVHMVLVLDIDLEASLYRIMRDYTGMGETGETLLINADGYAITELRHHKDAVLHVKIDAAPANRARKGRTGIIQSEDYRDVEVLAAYTFLPSLGWGFVAKQDISELHAPFYDRLTVLYLWLFLGAMLAMVVAFVLARTTTRSLNAFVSSSKRIASGEFIERIDDQRLDELGDLATSFNIMAEKIEARLHFARYSTSLFAPSMQCTNAQELGDLLTKSFSDYINTLISAFYIIDEDEKRIIPLSTVGGDLENLPSFRLDQPNGQLALACVRKDVAFLRLDAPVELEFMTVAGAVRPADVATIPLMSEKKLLGAVLLAKHTPFTPIEKETISSIQGELTSLLLRVRAHEARDAIAHELGNSNQELESMAEELQQQAEELQYQNLLLEEQKKQLQNANKLKGEFLSNMSHELRTPLNAIMSLSRALTLQTGTRLTEEEQEYLNIVQRNARELLDLINDLLNLARLESGRVDLKITSIDMVGLLSEMIENLEPLATDKKTTIKLDVLTTMPPVKLDERSVRIIVQNILGNAIKYTKEGSINVSLRHQNRECIIEFADTGIGIPEEDLPHIFDEFRQVDGSSARQFEGAGLGLSIASKTTSTLRGRIEVKSRIGVGTVFIVHLPVELPAHESDDTPHATTRVARPVDHDGNTKLLIVEDNEATVIQLEGIFKDEGFDIEVLSEGKMAVPKVREWAPNILVLDLMLPGTSGFQVLQQLRAAEETRTLPVLVLTAKSLTAEEWHTLSLDEHVRILQKGKIDEEDLILAIYALLQAHRATDGIHDQDV